MAYEHGITILESPTPLTAPVQVDSALPVVFGAAPVHRLENPEAAVNVPLIIYSYSEGVQKLGYSDNWYDTAAEKRMFTLSEFLYSQFRIHGIAPVIAVNPWNPLKGAADATLVLHPVINGIATIDDDMAIISTVEVIKGTGESYERDKDYTLTYDGDKLLVTVIKSGGIPSDAATLNINYRKAVMNITEKDIIGGIDEKTKKRTGIELVDEVYLRFQKNAGFLLAPGWSSNPGVAAILIAKAKAHNNGNFRCVALLDFPTDDTFDNYSDLPQWKNQNSYVDPFAFGDWPCVAVGDRVFHASTRLAGLFGQTDAAHNGRPYVSASNKGLSMTKMCREDGTEISLLDQGQANLLNENGIGTFLNWGGWRAWGNETTAYPGNTDVKDCERSIRRMFCWTQNTVNRTIWQMVDWPIHRITIDRILLTINEWFNALTAENAILGGRCEFLRSDNGNSSLLSGRLYFRTYICPPGAAKNIVFNFQYDPDYLETLFV